MAKMTNAGMAVAISASTPATEDVAGYDALTYTSISGVTSIGAFGAVAALVESNPLETGIVEKYKGMRNYGSMTLELDYDPDAAFNTIIEDAVEGATLQNRHSISVTYPDGKIRYFGVKVFSVPENPGGTNSMVTRSVQLELETAIVRKDS